MFEGLTKRDFVALVGALIVVCGLSAWDPIYVFKNYVLGTRDDPIARAVGLKAEQIIPTK
jgi:hypothetical protein